MVEKIFPRRIEQGAFLQLILLHSLYSQSGSESILFQGGTALRWIYGGQRASEDLYFVSPVQRDRLRTIMDRTFRLARPLSTPQFGQGVFEEKVSHSPEACYRTYAIYRPENQRERIAVRLEVEKMASNRLPEYRKIPFMDCPPIFGVMRQGTLTLPYSSSIVTVETPEEILTDKLRALFERPYLKGRDLYDLWFLHTMLRARTNLSRLQSKFESYTRPFSPARKGIFFLKRESRNTLKQVLVADLHPFLPSPTYRELESSGFSNILQVLKEILDPLLQEGLEELVNSYA
jgi:predicted nucleotidyltransferase component of viral defense system